jgi:hypothetical protein
MSWSIPARRPAPLQDSMRSRRHAPGSEGASLRQACARALTSFTAACCCHRAYSLATTSAVACDDSQAAGTLAPSLRCCQVAGRLDGRSPVRPARLHLQVGLFRRLVTSSAGAFLASTSSLAGMPCALAMACRGGANASRRVPGAAALLRTRLQPASSLCRARDGCLWRHAPRPSRRRSCTRARPRQE